MFKNIDYTDTIPPNFIQSILTNISLYEMFKNEFENNAEYFQNISREVYLREMLKFISDALFSSNIFHIYEVPEDLDRFTEGKLFFIKNFYDDFMLEAFKTDPTDLLKTDFFKGLEFARVHDLYAGRTSEFNELYQYIFKDSLDYSGIVEVLLKEPLQSLKTGEQLTLKDFDVLCNYVKNNISGKVDLEIAKGMLHNHAYKKNHIFDPEVSKVLTSSVIFSYLSTYSIEPRVEFIDLALLDDENKTGKKDNTIYIDSALIEGFCSLNYIELFEEAFYQADILKDMTLLRKNAVSCSTLKTIMNIVSLGVDLENFEDQENLPLEYTSDLRASSFIKALRFFSSFGVNLFDSYIESKSASLNINDETKDSLFSRKEISLDQKFQIAFQKLSNKTRLIEKYRVLKILYKRTGERKSTLELIKSVCKTEDRDFLIDYLHSRILDPSSMIEDVEALASYRSKDESIRSLIEQELKYIYVDTFFYSLDSYLKLNIELDREDYLSDTLLKINCIKDTPITHRFIDEAMFTIESVQNS